MSQRRHLGLGLCAWLAALGVLPASPVSAAPPGIPALVSYQGVLLDSLGQPRTGSVSLTLRIYDALTGGTLLYVQTLGSVPLNDGVFTVAIGPTGSATDSPTNPLTTSFADALAGDLAGVGPNRFLQVTVGSEGALSRTQILSVPYALRAESAELAETALEAQTALDASSLSGFPGAFLTELIEHSNLDDSGPFNLDPSEGLGDTDGDLLANFVDADNDNDSLDDSQEVADGSDINLVTPIVTLVNPPSAPSSATTSVTVEGANFQAGLTVVFGSQTPAPSGISATSFGVQVGPQQPGFASVEVTLPNGESDLLMNGFRFGSSVLHTLSLAAATQLSLDVKGSKQTVLGASREYAVDTDANGSPESDFLLDTYGWQAGSYPGQLAVAWDPTGAVTGLRCRQTDASHCIIELLRDADADFGLEDETGVALETLLSPKLLSPSIEFDPSGRPVLGYVKKSGQPETAMVAHDRDGDGLFTGVNEQVAIEVVVLAADESNLGEVAVDPSGRAAHVYWDGANLRVAWDRSGDGDFGDAPGGNPELSTLATPGASPDCLGADFAPDGDLAVVYDTPAGPVFARDGNGDGDFADPGESTSLAASSPTACDVEAGDSALAAVHDAGGSVVLLVDANDDGDFADFGESTQLFSSSNAHLAIGFNSTGTALVATGNAVEF